LGVIEALGLSDFLVLLLSCTHLLVVDFLQVVSASGCRLVKSKHLNLCVVCDSLSLLLCILLIFRIPWVLGNRINFLTISPATFLLYILYFTYIATMYTSLLRTISYGCIISFFFFFLK
jgi:hypothetical protein